jgi:hypothetical protein
MSRRQRCAFVLSAVLAFSLIAVPVSAAQRDRDGGRDRDRPGIERVASLIRRIVHALDTMSVPIP